jgi:hypothetical protein
MASVAPSPEVVVDGSVVEGSVVEGGAGDVVVAGSLVAGPVVAGSLVTGQPHVEQPPQHYCKYCGLWMSGDPESVRRHEEGPRHKDRVARENKELAWCARERCSRERCSACGELLSCHGQIIEILSGLLVMCLVALCYLLPAYFFAKKKKKKQ